MNYELKQYDNVLLKFSLKRKALGEIEYCITWTNEPLKHLLPIGLQLTPNGLAKWLSSRVIPKNREFVQQILSKSGLTVNDTIGIIDLCKGLSLNDSYWIVPEGFDGTFDKYNLYQHRFSTVLSLIAYTGFGSSNNPKRLASSPEYTTDGMLRKCWVRDKGQIYLYKGGTSGAINAGKEPYSEFYASQIASAMGIEHVDYNLKRWKHVLCSTCKLFTNIDISYVPIYRFLEHCTLTTVANFLQSLGENYYNAFADMLVFDAVIFNTDRHFGNFGLLVDNKTNKPISFAPIFDNGLSLFNYALDDEIADLDNYAKTRIPAYGGTFDEIAQTFVSARQKEQLRHLLTFKFAKHSKYNLPPSRLKAIEKFVQKRARELLNM